MKTKTDLNIILLAPKMAKSVADQINYVGLDAPSDAPWSRMDEIISSFMNEKEQKSLKTMINGMTYKDVMKLEAKVNQLLETGKYD